MSLAFKKNEGKSSASSINLVLIKKRVLDF
jgi:hypothetical protein